MSDRLSCWFDFLIEVTKHFGLVCMYNGHDHTLEIKDRYLDNLLHLELQKYIRDELLLRRCPYEPVFL